MRRAGRIAVGTIGGLAGLLGAGWLGLQVAPAPFPPYPEPTAELGAVDLPAGLPPPVARYFREVVGERVPRIESAVISGRGRLRFAGVTMPARLRFTHDAGRGYRHYIETTWLGMPVLRVNEWYLDGRGRLELPFGTVVDEPKVNEAGNLGLWAESFWLPSVLVTDPRVRWEPIDGRTARLVVPFGQAEHSLIVTFDEATGLMRHAEAPRYRGATDETRTPWRIEALGWRTFHGVRIPSPAAATWLDEGSPWLVIDVEEVVYNVDVSAYLRAWGP